MSRRPTWPPIEVEVHGSLTTMDLDPDLDLLEAWRSGDKSAAAELIRRHHKAIRSVVVTKIPEASVNDVVHDVVQKLLEGCERFRGDATFRTYAMKVTRNTIAEFYRKRKPIDSLDALEVSAHDNGVGMSTLLADKRQHRLLLEALRSIKLDDQFILELHYWEKMTGPQLAQVFECSESKIRHRLHDARSRLRKAVEKIAGEHRELADTLTDLDTWAVRLREALEPEFQRLLPR